MPANVIQLPGGPRWRVLIAHRRSEVRHVLRTLIETDDAVIFEASDGEMALTEVGRKRFDLLVLELDLPLKDGVAVMQLHRMLLAHEPIAVEPPAVIFTLPPEVRGNATLTDHLRSLGAAGFVDDAPRPDAAGLIAATLEARSTQASGKPAAA